MRSVRSPRTVFLCLSLVVGLGACKCEKEPEAPSDADGGGRDYVSTVSKLPGAPEVDVAGLIPAGVDWALLSDHPADVHRWLEGQAWWQGVKRSPLWADLTLSGGMYALSTARHRLASLSPVEFKEPDPAQLLASPMGIAQKRMGDHKALLLVKQIDLKVQALDRLAEVFNQVRKSDQIQTSEVEGVTVRSLQLVEGRSLHYALYSNLLLAADDADLLREAVGLAAGRSEASMLSEPETASLIGERGQAQLTALFQPAAISPWLGLLLPARTVAVDLRLGTRAQWLVHGVTPQGPQAPLDAAGLRGLASMIPLQARAVYGFRNLDPKAWLTPLAAAVPGAEKGIRPAGEALAAAMTGEAFVVWLGMWTKGRSRPEIAVILKLREAGAAATHLAALFDVLFSGASEDAGDGIRMAPGQEIQVAYAVADGAWVVLGTSADAVRQVLAAQRGKAPSILDLGGFETGVLAPAAPFFGLGYLDSQTLFADVSAYARAVVQAGDRFDAKDVSDTVEPFFEALGRAGKLGGGLAARDKRIDGRFSAL